MDICDIVHDYVNFPIEKPQIFRMLIIFLSQFIDVITQNVILSRRLAYIIAKRFKIYKHDYDCKRGLFFFIILQYITFYIFIINF